MFYESEQEYAPGNLRKLIGSELPTYMIPTRFEYMKLFPRNTNGKIDRLKLKESINKIK